MIGFKSYLTEVANTHGADVNEILYGFYMVKSWSKFEGAKDAQKQLERNKDLISPQEYIDQDERAKIMAKETTSWMKANGYGKPVRAWWTARAGVLSKAIGQTVDSKKNPTDVLVKTADDKFLGLSAKSTKKMKGDIGFKNPGLGTVEKALNLNLKKYLDDAVQQAILKYDLPKAASARKKVIRAEPDVQPNTIKLGLDVMESIRDDLYKKLSSMKQKDLRQYIYDYWMDANEGLIPPYIKVTGNGKNGKYSASLTNPLRNSKLDAINSEDITVEKVGKDSVGIKAGKKIMKMRVKFESEKLASSIKFSGEPW